MTNSFLTKRIQVNVDASTWGSAGLPIALRGASGRCSIDIGQALHMLGTLTMPNLMSPASPALFWAWLRYYLAPAASSDFRITMDFAGLDPHQKGILSDDFGVAIATQWLADRYGGFVDIVDGRRFILQFGHLLRNRHKSKAKVGPSKAPDFVLCDKLGKWHVLECKGTQASREYQKKSLKVAVAQKHAIRLSGAIKGEQLAASLYIANENGSLGTHLTVIDPEDPPLIELRENQADEIDMKVKRLAVARALGVVGLNEAAVELSLPPDIDPFSELLQPSESSRVRSSRIERRTRASTQLRERSLDTFLKDGIQYEGREVSFELPATADWLPFRRVVIRQGINRDVVSELSAFDALSEHQIDDRIEAFTHGAQVRQDSDYSHLELQYGKLQFSEMAWK